MRPGVSTVEEEGIVLFRSKMRVVVVFLILRAGVMMNCWMRPEEIGELTQQMNDPKLAHVHADRGRGRR